MRQVAISDALAGPVGEVRSASTASGGTSLTTTTTRVLFPHGTSLVQLLPRNFSGASVVRVALLPYAQVLVTNDGLSSVTDVSRSAQDGSSTSKITLSALAPLANGGAVYLGVFCPLRGLDIDVDAPNSNASVLSCAYWNGSSWAALTLTDGTAVGGATFAQDGLITWTPPSDAASSSFASVVSRVSVLSKSTRNLYWYRFGVSALLDASVTLNGCVGLPRSTNYGELVETLGMEFRTQTSVGGHAGVEALTDAGTANLIVNCFTSPEGVFA